MSQESFESEFKKLREMPEAFVLRGSTIIVEVLPPEEIKTNSGLIVASAHGHAKGNSVDAHRIEIGKVLMTGPGYWVEGTDEDLVERDITGRYEPLEVQPGAIVLLAKYSTDYLSHFPGISRPTGNKLAMIKMDSILAYYPSQEAYEAAKLALNS